MTELVQGLAWQDDALELRAVTDLTPSEIGERVGKHPATIRKLFARNPPSDRVMSSAEADEAFSGDAYAERAEQTTVYDHLPPSEEPPPEDDPEYEIEVSDDEIRGAVERLRERDITTGVLGIDTEAADAAVTAFIREAGEATGPLQTRPGEENPEPLEDLPARPEIRGTVQLALDFGPNAAPVTCATVKFTSEKLTSGYFEMGDIVSGRFTARITGINGAEKLDKDLDEFVAKPQAQTATITEIVID